MNLFKLVGSIFIKSDEANKQIDGTSDKAKQLASTVGKSFQDAGSKMTNLGKALAPVSLAFAGALTASVKGASDFQNGMAKMSTLFDTSKVSVQDLSKQFLDLSNKTGISATELAEAGYQALSAGVDVKNSTKFVETAGKLAKAGFTTTTTSVDVLTTAMNAYGKQAGTAEQIANKLVRTQNLGKTTVDELGSSMGKIIPTASGMNVSIDNLMSGYVSLTKQGIATAEATTYMNSMFNELGDSGTTVGQILKDKTGKSFQELMNDGESVSDVLQILQDEANASGTNFNELWGSAEAGKASLALLNGGVDEFNATVETMASDTDDVGDALQKLETPSVKAKKALNQIKNSGIELGTAFLSSMLPVIDKVVAGIEKATSWFNKLPTGVKTTIASVMAFVAILSPALIIGGKTLTLVGNFITVLPKIKTALIAVKTACSGFFTTLLANPIVLVIAGIVALIAVITHLWNHSEAFRNFWINLWNAIKTAVMTVWNAIKTAIITVINAIKTAIITVFNAIKTVIMLYMNAYKTVIITAWNVIKTVVTTIINAIKTVIVTIFNAIKNSIGIILNAIKTIFTTVWNSIKAKVSNAVNNIKTIIVNAFNKIKSSTSTIWNNVKNSIKTVWNSIKTNVSNAVNNVKSTVSNVFDNIKSIASSVWNGIKSAIINPIQSAKNEVFSILNSIKGKFPLSIGKIFSNLKLPHISISGGKAPFGIGGEGSLPKFSVNWYKKAMDNPYMFTSPTIFDYNPVSGAKVAGEAGDEMMYGHDNLMRDIETAVSNKIDTNDQLESIVSAFFAWMQSPNGLTKIITDVLIDNVKFMLDDRQVGRIVSQYVR